MNNIVWLTPTWTIVFILAIVTLCVTVFWDNIAKMFTAIGTDVGNNVKTHLGNKSIKEYILGNLWIIRTIVAVCIYAFVIRETGNYSLWVVGIVTGVVFLIYTLTYLFDENEFGDDWVDVVKSFIFFTVFVGLIGIIICSFIFASKTALICLIITIITTFMLPKDF